MKNSTSRVLSILLLSLLFAGTLHAQVQTFLWQNVQRQYLLRMPEQHDGTPPVVFFLHGLGDNITRCDNEFNFQGIADQYGWAMIVPQARNLGMGNMWNVGMTNSTVDDAGFLLALLDSLTAANQLDPDSVFFTGFSMGGFMTHKMAIEHGDRITACAPVSGLIMAQLANQTPVAPVRMLHIHGTTDNVVGYNGYSAAFGSTLGLSVPSILQYWQTANGCSGDPTIDTLPDIKNDGLRFVRHVYDCGTDLQHLEVIGGTHTWYDDQYDVSYMAYIHDFFVGAGGEAMGVSDHSAHVLRVWPNPGNGIFQIEVQEDMTVEVVDMQGRVLASRQLSSGTDTLDLRHLPQGMYLLTREGREVAKLMLR